MSVVIECPSCRSVLPVGTLGCTECGACVRCKGDRGAACVCHRQLELICVDCDAPAFPGDRRCAEHSWNADARAAYRQIKLDLATDAALEPPPFDEGQA